MQELVLMAGTIIASSMSIALAGLILGNAIRNSRRPRASRKSSNPQLIAVPDLLDACLGKTTRRGYDTPELHRYDSLERLKQSGNRQKVQ